MSNILKPLSWLEKEGRQEGRRTKIKTDISALFSSHLNPLVISSGVFTPHAFWTMLWLHSPFSSSYSHTLSSFHITLDFYIIYSSFPFHITSMFLFSPTLSLFLSSMVWRWLSWLPWVLCWSVYDVSVHRAPCWSTLCVSMQCKWPVAWPIWSRGGSSTGTWQPGTEDLFKLDLIFFSS